MTPLNTGQPEHQIIFVLACHNQYGVKPITTKSLTTRILQTHWQFVRGVKMMSLVFGMNKQESKGCGLLLLSENRCWNLPLTWGRTPCVHVAWVPMPFWPTTYYICLEPWCRMPLAPMLITHYPRFGRGFQAASDTIPLIRVAACC